MTKINYFTRTITRIFATMLVTFVWSNYYFRNFHKALFVSIAAAITLELILYIFTKQKDKLKAKNAAMQSQLNAINNALVFSSNSKNLSYYANIIKTKYCSQKYKDCIIAVNNFEKMCFVPIYLLEPITKMNINECIKIAADHKCTRLIILTNYCTDELLEYSSNIVGISVEISDIMQTYTTLICGNTPPSNCIQIKKTKLHFKDLLKVAFDKKRAKGYLLCSIILLISSLFVPYNLYYVIMGSITLILALICQTIKVH